MRGYPNKYSLFEEIFIDMAHFPILLFSCRAHYVFVLPQ